MNKARHFQHAFSVRPRRFQELASVTLTVILLAGCPSSDEESSIPVSQVPNLGVGPRDDSESASAMSFTEITDEMGVDCNYRNGKEIGHASMLETLGGGVALVDLNGDSHLDLFFPGGGGFDAEQNIFGRCHAVYYGNDGTSFTEVTKFCGIDLSAVYTHGVFAADYDQDGFRDLLVTGWGRLQLYRNNGDGTFEDRTAESRLSDDGWSTGAGWGDLNGDSHPDLYVAHYGNWSFENHPYCSGTDPLKRDTCAPLNFEPVPDVVYFSNGDGTFRDATIEANLEDGGKGLCVVMADIDQDNDLDFYVTNDGVPNYLYRNTGNGRMEDIGSLLGAAVDDRGMSTGSMGVDIGDFNSDRRPDLCVTNYQNECTALYRNQAAEGDMMFQYVSQHTGIDSVESYYVGWGTVFCDFDHDGDEDIFISNGHVLYYPTNSEIEQRPILFENRDGKRFHNIAGQAGDYTSSKHNGRGLATGDLDGDGDVDFVVSHVNANASVVRNDTNPTGHWLLIRLVGIRSSRDAIGATIRIETESRTLMRFAKGGGSYASTCDPRIHVGLADDNVVTSLTINWPSGLKQTLTNVAVDQELLIHEEEG